MHGNCNVTFQMLCLPAAGQTLHHRRPHQHTQPCFQDFSAACCLCTLLETPHDPSASQTAAAAEVTKTLEQHNCLRRSLLLLLPLPCHDEGSPHTSMVYGCIHAAQGKQQGSKAVLTSACNTAAAAASSDSSWHAVYLQPPLMDDHAPLKHFDW